MIFLPWINKVQALREDYCKNEHNLRKKKLFECCSTAVIVHQRNIIRASNDLLWRWCSQKSWKPGGQNRVSSCISYRLKEHLRLDWQERSDLLSHSHKGIPGWTSQTRWKTGQHLNRGAADARDTDGGPAYQHTSHHWLVSHSGDELFRENIFTALLKVVICLYDLQTNKTNSYFLQSCFSVEQ